MMKYDNCLHINMCRHAIFENCIDGCQGEHYEPRNLLKAEASDAALCAVPIVVGNSYGIQFLCSACDFPEDETLTMDMKHCWNCGVKLDWSKCEY
jgi:hypothetical protein